MILGRGAAAIACLVASTLPVVVAFPLPGFAGSVLAGAAPAASAVTGSALEAHAFRLRPGEDLLGGILAQARALELRAGCVLTAVGSIRHLRLRFADQPGPTELEGRFEIVSLSGTVTRDVAHLHLAVSDGEGRTLGGHLVPGNPVYTTAEIVLGELPGTVFSRETDPVTSYRELIVAPRALEGRSPATSPMARP